MPELLEITSSARFLFAPSTIPVARLVMNSTQASLNALFKLRNMQVGADVNQFQLISSAGEFDGIPILFLSFEPAAINLTVAGLRPDLDRVYEAVQQLLISVDPARRFERPNIYTSTYQTQSAVRLSIPFDSLVSPALLDFVHGHQADFESEKSAAVIGLANLSFSVQYTTRTPDYVYLPKLITIEPRNGSNPADQIYYVSTPTDSDTHLKLIGELENTLGRRSAKSAPKKLAATR